LKHLGSPEIPLFAFQNFSLLCVLCGEWVRLPVRRHTISRSGIINSEMHAVWNHKCSELPKALWLLNARHRGKGNCRWELTQCFGKSLTCYDISLVRSWFLRILCASSANGSWPPGLSPGGRTPVLSPGQPSRQYPGKKTEEMTGPAHPRQYHKKRSKSPSVVDEHHQGNS